VLPLPLPLTTPLILTLTITLILTLTITLILTLTLSPTLTLPLTLRYLELVAGELPISPHISLYLQGTSSSSPASSMC